MDVRAAGGMTARVASFATETRFEDLPDGIAEAVRWALLDTVGVIVAGVDTVPGRSVIGLVGELGGTGSSTVIGTDLQCDPASAALVNGTTGHALDYDDQSWTMGGHPSVVLLPAVLALAEESGASGRDVIRAYAVGFEAASILGRT